MDNQPQIASLASIHRYPVKSMAGEAVTNTELTQFGLRFDRLYAFESSGAPAGMLRLTSRQRQRMLHYQPTLQEDGQTTVRLPTGKQMLVSAPALLDYLRSQDSESSKFVLTEASTPQTDVRPLSLISLQTITRLSAEIGHLLDPRRFRANLYLDIPAGPFAEDRLAGRALRIGTSATILIRERDPRCRFITYDPDDPEATPLFSLMKLLDREHEGRAGVYATVQIPGPIATGDPVYLVND